MWAWRSVGLSRSRAAYASGEPTLLHGAWGLPKIAHDAGGRLVIYDASALHGPVSFDAARWAARLRSAAAPPTDVAARARWVTVEGIPWARADDDLLAAECVLEAGSRAGVHAAARRPADADPAVHALLEEARRLFGR